MQSTRQIATEKRRRFSRRAGQSSKGTCPPPIEGNGLSMYLMRQCNPMLNGHSTGGVPVWAGHRGQNVERPVRGPMGERTRPPNQTTNQTSQKKHKLKIRKNQMINQNQAHRITAVLISLQPEAITSPLVNFPLIYQKDFVQQKLDCLLRLLRSGESGSLD